MQSNHDLCIGRGFHRGHVMVLVLIAMAVAMVLSLSFLAGATTTTRVATQIESHASARQIAESGLAAAIAYLEQNPDWYSQHVSGVWLQNMPLHDGTLTLTVGFNGQSVPGSIHLEDSSFEDHTASLPNPLLFPPMTGTIGEWDVSRQALAGAVTGLTVPRVGTIGSASATEGSNIAYIQFVTSLAGSATIRQDMGVPASPNTSYTLEVNVGTGGLAAVLAGYEIRLYAGTTLLGSSADSQLLTILDLAGDWRRHIVSVTTGDSPPAGPLRVEFAAQSVLGLLSAVAFDEARLSVTPGEPAILTAVGRYADTSHSVTAEVMIQSSSLPVQMLRWREP